MFQPSYSRRRVLRQGSAATLLGALVGISGCSSSILEPNNSRELPNYATWAPAPDRLFGDTESQFSSRWYPFRARRFGELAAYLSRREESFEDTTLYQDGMAHPVLDVEPSDAGMELRGGGRGISVLETSLSEEDVIEAYQTPESGEPITDPFESIGEYEGYRLLSGAEGDWVIGVNDGLVVEAFSSATQDPLGEKRPVVEAIIDARAGEGRYVDAERSLSELVHRLGSGIIISIDPPVQRSESNAEAMEYSEPIASGVTYSAAETRNARQVLAFASKETAGKFADSPNTDPSRAWLDVSVSREDRYVEISGTHHPVTR